MRIFLTIFVVMLGLVTLGCGKQQTTVEGKGGKKLTLTVPDTVTVKAGDTSKLELGVSREKFDEDIILEIANLPNGVIIVEESMLIPKGKNEGHFTLKAKNDAAVGKGHAIKVTAKGGGMTVGPKEVKMNVLEGEKTSKNDKNNKSVDLAKMKETVKTKADEALKKINTTIDSLKEQAKNAKGDAQKKYKQAMESLETKRDALQKQLTKLGEQSQESWNAFYNNVTEAINDSRRAAEDALEDLNKK